MNKIVRTYFPQAIRVIDRFHVQKLACDAVQEMHIKYRGDAIQQESDAMEEAKWKRKLYLPIVFENGDTKKQLLVRSRYLLFKSAEKWTEKQKRAGQESFLLNTPILKRLMGYSLPKNDIQSQHH